MPQARHRHSLPRRPGRPRQKDEDLRQRLLDAAIGRFTTEGINASTLRGIAKQAAVTPALVHYYFGTKEQLVAAMIQERLLPIFAELAEIIAASAAENLVRGFVVGIHRLVERHPWLPVLWVREILCDGGALRELLLSRVAPQIPLRLAERFAKAQRAGQLNADLDPRLLVVSLIGLTMFPLAARPIWSRVFNAGDIGYAQLQQHSIALLERGMEIDHGK